MWKFYIKLFARLQRTKKLLSINNREGSPRGVMAEALNCDIIVIEFELQSHYNDTFRANTFGKGMNPFIPSAIK